MITCSSNILMVENEILVRELVRLYLKFDDISFLRERYGRQPDRRPDAIVNLEQVVRALEMEKEKIEKILTHIAPPRKDKGKNSEAPGVWQDITESRHEFITGVCHEFRTPLASILLFLHAVTHGIITGETAGDYYNQFIHQEILRLNSLLDDLLDLTTLTFGKDIWKLGYINVQTLVSRVYIKLKPEIDRHLMVVEMEFPINLPHMRGDEERVEQVLTNILANALQYSSDGGRIKIMAQAYDNFVTISVSDQGPGIPPEDLPYIWDCFYRVEKSRNRSTGGTGLGLAVVKQIVEGHGGSVEVQSEPGWGSTFSFILPAVLVTENELFS